jgi:putative transposase
MARKVRLYSAGSCYHVMLRGNNGQDIFYSHQDRCKLCYLLQEISERFNVRVHAFCLMDNHIHLVLQTSENHISKLIQNIAFRYARYINNKEKRVGHLFQGRFKSILVEDGEYLLKLVRYVHLNPVKAGIVEKPENYHWSSHRAYLGMTAFTWLTTNHVYEKFDLSLDVARTCYQRYIDNEPLSEIDLKNYREGNQGEGVLGSDDFLEDILKEKQTPVHKNYTLDQLIEIVCQVLGHPISVIKRVGKDREGSRARSFIAYFIKRIPHLTLKEFALRVERDVSSLSKPVREIELRLHTDGDLKVLLDKVQEKLYEIPKSQA